MCNTTANVGSPSSGLHCSGCAIAHQWAWDGATWHEVNLGDAVSFSGEQVVSDPATGHALAIDSSNFWAWNGTRWSPHLLPAGLRARHGMALATDTGHRDVVLFGGHVGDAPAADTWTWDGSTWTHRAGPLLPVPTPYVPLPPPPPPMETAPPAPPGHACEENSLTESRQPDGAVNITVTVGAPAVQCPGVTALLELADAHGSLKIVGNDSPVGVGTSTFLWRNWCDAAAGKIVAQLGRTQGGVVVLQLPTCVDNHELSTLTLSSSQTTVSTTIP
jgi:hypothetical protein